MTESCEDRSQDGQPTYQDFLKGVIKRRWSSDQTRKVELIALLLASREAWEVAWDETDGSTLLKGAAGATAVTMILRTLLGGPLGVILAGASVASLVAVYAKHHDEISARSERYQELVGAYEPTFDKVVANCSEAGLDDEQRGLMLDGLTARFLKDLEELPEAGD